MAKNLEAVWIRVSDELGIEIEAPFSLLMTDGSNLNAGFIVKYFGGTCGMLIFKNYREVKPYINEIKNKGYGFSILDEPEMEYINIDDYIDVLRDWGWSGDVNRKPNWL